MPTPQPPRWFTRNRVVLFLGFATILLLDRLTKWVVSLDTAQRTYGPLVVERTTNASSAFSLPIPSFLVVVIASSLIVLILFSLRICSLTQQWGLILILAGGVSNTVDRLVYGFVIDSMTIGSASLNLADLAVILGATVVLVSRLVAFQKNPGYHS